MPREIADSDDEAELTLSRTSCTSKHGACLPLTVTAEAPQSTAERALDPLLDVEFDQFLSPTQRISSFDGGDDAWSGSHALNAHELDSSTDRFLGEIARRPAVDNSSNLHGTAESEMGGRSKSKKRSRTQVGEGHTVKSAVGSSARKRTKTAEYAGSSRSTELSDAQMQVEALINDASTRQDGEDATDAMDIVDPVQMVSIEPRTQYTSPLDLSLSLSANCDEHVLDNGAKDTPSGQQYIPPQHYTPNLSFFGTNLHGGTTSRSSIGNHQSYSINPNGLNVDFNEINPFGSLSQISHAGDLESDETRGISVIFSRHQENATPEAASVEPHTETVQNGIEDMQPVKRAMEAPEQLEVEEQPPQGSPSFSPITNPDDQKPDLESHVSKQDLDETIEIATNALANPVEESVQPLPKKRTRKSDQKPAEEDLDELQMDDHPSTRTLRAGTVESVDNVSEVSQATTGSRSGRGRKGQKVDRPPPEVLSKKLPSSDLGLDNKAVIGLSPERYVPRLSKRRGRIDQERAPENVPIKEQPGEEQVATLETPIKEVPPKGRKGRKSKVKRAKTSAAALLSKMNDFLDEDEKEEAKGVVFMDEQPAKVKFQPMPEFSPNRQPKKEEPNKQTEDLEAEETAKSTDRQPKVAADAPVLLRTDENEEEPPVIPESKKRGMKRKKVAAELDEEAVQGEREQIQEADPPRSALAAKDTTPKLKSAKVTPPALEDEADDKENTSPTKFSPRSPGNGSASAPLQPGTPAPVVASKPTHSPLKPTSNTPLFNARTRIGLSKRHSIPSLLRKVDRNKEPPKVVEKKEKLTKRQLEEREQERIAREEADAEGREYVPLDILRERMGCLLSGIFELQSEEGE